MTSDQIALQLYTLRDHLRTPGEIAITLKKVRTIGYHTVQLSGLGPIKDGELLKILHGEGLAVCATHEPSDLIRQKPEQVAERVAGFGCLHTAYAFAAGVDWSKEEQVEHLVKDLNHAGAIFRKAGLTLSYHNHAIEFVPFKGTTALDYIFQNTGANLCAELDTYWVQYGGGNLQEWFQKLKDRMPLLHLKDYAYTLENKPAYAAIGSGNFSWPKIIAAADAAGCRWYIVEQDITPGDPFEAITESLHYIKEKLLS